MKIAVITVAGVSSRFNEGIADNKKVLKCLYTEGNIEDTLLYHLLLKCSYADYIVLVGGYKFEELSLFVKNLSRSELSEILLVENKCYTELGSGYSLFLGLEAAFKHNPDEILFVEGDLDVDNESFKKVVTSDNSVLTYTFEPIYANKAVVLYKDDKDKYRYAFNSSHGLLRIENSFSCILNSGQIWKFTEMDSLKQANEEFYRTVKAETNLKIIQNYLDKDVGIELIPLHHWVNCNTREDYKKIFAYWGNEI